jgi:hypothetical protein
MDILAALRKEEAKFEKQVGAAQQQLVLSAKAQVGFSNNTDHRKVRSNP